MTDSLRHRCELFVGNRAILLKEFKFDTAYTLSLCSSLYASKKAIADPTAIKKKRSLIYRDTGIFSAFRSMSLILSLSTLLSLDVSCDANWKRTLEAFESLRKKAYSSTYMSLAAYLLASLSSKSADALANETYSMLDLIKKLYPWRTCGDDIVYAALLAITGVHESILLKSKNECEKLLSKSVSKQSLKQISLLLSIAGADTELYCQRFLRIRELLDLNGISINKNDRYTLSQICTLSVLPVPEEEIIDSVLDVYEYLKAQKGFGWTFGKAQRTVYSIIQTYGEYTPESIDKADARVISDVNTVINSVIASVTSVIASEITYAAAAIATI